MDLHCTLKLTFQVLVTLFGFGGFFWLCLAQIEKFLSRKTAVSVAWDKVDTFQAPTFVFCNQVPYVDQEIVAMMAKSDFDKFATVVDVNFSSISSWVELLKPETNHDAVKPHEYFLYTRYNGKCKAFRLREEMKPRDYLVFNARGQIDIFFIMPDQELFLIDQNWDKDSMIVSSIGNRKSEPLFELFEERYKKKTDCDSEALMTDYTYCLKKKVNKTVSEFGQTCLFPHQKVYLLDNDTYEECTNSTNNILVMQTIAQALSDEHFEKKCPKPCLTKKLHIRKADQVYESTRSATKYDISIIYPTNIVTEYEEYFIYDLNGIVASVGGGLGLFLGFSCLSTALKVIDFFSKKTKIFIQKE